MRAAPSQDKEKTNRVARACALVVFCGLIAACSSSSVAPHYTGAKQRGGIQQLKTPAVPPVPIEFLASYAMPETFDPDEYLSGIQLGSDGNIWASLYDSNQIARFDSSGAAVAFPLPTQAPPCLLPGCSTGPTDMTLGPDGNVYVSLAQDNAIAQVAPSGSVKVFPLDPNVFPMAPQDEGPRGITIGPDGNIWFVHSNSSKIGRMTVAGDVIDVYSMPTGNSMGGRITTGPDGNMWFTEVNNSKVGRIDISTGQVVEFDTPTPNSYPHSIATGDDGNIWITERDANQVARITPEGIITEFGTLSPISRPLYITAGPDGSLWFAEYYRDGVCRLDPTALTFVEYTEPSGLLVRGLTTGLGGTVWTTDDNNDAVDVFGPNNSGGSIKRHLLIVKH